MSKAVLAAHNDAALVSLIFMELTGMFAWLALWQYRRFKHPRAGAWLPSCYFRQRLFISWP